MTISELKQQISMRELITHYGIFINQRNKAICPFHQDSKPSLHIYDKDNRAVCFVCHFSGDIMDFVQCYENMTRTDAIKWLLCAFNLSDDSNISRTKILPKKCNIARQNRMLKWLEGLIKEYDDFNVKFSGFDFTTWTNYEVENLMDYYDDCFTQRIQIIGYNQPQIDEMLYELRGAYIIIKNYDTGIHITKDRSLSSDIVDDIATRCNKLKRALKSCNQGTFPVIVPPESIIIS